LDMRLFGYPLITFSGMKQRKTHRFRTLQGLFEQYFQ